MFLLIFCIFSSPNCVNLFHSNRYTSWSRPISLSLNTGSCRPISPCGLNTGFWLRLLPVGQYAFAVARGCATLTPGCILAPHQGALFPLSQTSHLPQADVNSPISKPHICLWQMSIPPLHLWRGGQGVRSIPPLNLWRGGQGVRSMTGGEVTG